MKITIIFLLSMMASITAHAQVDFGFGANNSDGTITIIPNSPQSPFFLNEIWRLQSNGVWEKVGTTYQAYPYTDTVSEGGRYYYKTRWYNPQVPNYSSFSISRFIDVDVDGAPSTSPNLQIPSVETDDGQFSVSWSAVAGATSYRLERNSGSSWLTISTGSQRSISELLPNGSYSYRVSASNVHGSGPLSTVKSITVNVTDTNPPATPANTFSPTYGVIVWSASSLATYYELSYGTTTLTINAPSTSSYRGSSMPSSWSVRACNAGGCSASIYGSR